MTTTPTSGAADLPEARLFTKKPVTIAAIQWTGKNLREVIAFTDGPPDTRTTHAGMAWEAYADLVARDGLMIYTLEDGPDRRAKHFADIGDWIIRGVKGEYYPCKPDIFEATYSPAALAAGQATAAPAQPAAPQGAAYAALPEPYCNAHDDADACYPDMFSEHQMRAFADATHTLRASHGQAPAKPDPAYSAACNLATALFKKHFAHLPDFASGQAVWSLCDSTAGVISQIDNMVSGLVQPPTTSPQAALAARKQGATQ